MPFSVITKLLLAIVDATVYVGGLDEHVTDTLLWELFLQAGPVGPSRSHFHSCL